MQAAPNPQPPPGPCLGVDKQEAVLTALRGTTETTAATVEPSWGFIHHCLHGSA